MKYENMVDYFILDYDIGKLFQEYFCFIVKIWMYADDLVYVGDDLDDIS